MAAKIDLAPKLRPFPDAESLAASLAERIAGEITRLRGAKPRVQLALCGGRSPVRTYGLLAEKDLPWQQVDLFLTDERCVPASDPEANAALLAGIFGSGAAAAATIHTIPGELGPQEAASRYQALLEERLEGRFDLVVLGIGEDGHVASLFPGHRALHAEPTALAVGVEGAPKPPSERVSLTLTALRAAAATVLIATGSGKAAALAGALAPPSELVPASLLDRGRLEVFYDREAAAFLPKTDGDGP